MDRFPWMTATIAQQEQDLKEKSAEIAMLQALLDEQDQSRPATNLNTSRERSAPYDKSSQVHQQRRGGWFDKCAQLGAEIEAENYGSAKWYVQHWKETSDMYSSLVATKARRNGW